MHHDNINLGVLYTMSCRICDLCPIDDRPSKNYLSTPQSLYSYTNYLKAILCKQPAFIFLYIP